MATAKKGAKSAAKKGAKRAAKKGAKRAAKKGAKRAAKKGAKRAAKKGVTVKGVNVSVVSKSAKKPKKSCRSLAVSKTRKVMLCPK
jgi:hypothetical protein